MPEATLRSWNQRPPKDRVLEPKLFWGFLGHLDGLDATDWLCGQRTEASQGPSSWRTAATGMGGWQDPETRAWGLRWLRAWEVVKDGCSMGTQASTIPRRGHGEGQAGEAGAASLQGVRHPPTWGTLSTPVAGAPPLPGHQTVPSSLSPSTTQKGRAQGGYTPPQGHTAHQEQRQGSTEAGSNAGAATRSTRQSVSLAWAPGSWHSKH